jgi:hypothetical protein
VKHFRVTHISPTGERHRQRMRCPSAARAQDYAFTLWGEPVYLAVIHLATRASAPRTNLEAAHHGR